jgi:hypothetical protein
MPQTAARPWQRVGPSSVATHTSRPALRRCAAHRSCVGVVTASVESPLSTAIDLRSRLQQTDLARRKQGGTAGWQEIAGSWVRSPPGRAWGVVHFTGGAVLGSYPHLCYDALLSSLSDASGLMVVATPYELGTDHDALASEAQRKLRATLSAVCVRDDYDVNMLPLFGLGHSLGAKLQVLLACRGGAQRAAVLLAFNNASATDSVRVLEQFARAFLQDGRAAGRGVSDAVLGAMPFISAMAERAASAAGLNFTPGPPETLQRATAEYMVRRSLMLAFDNDTLHHSSDLALALQSRKETIELLTRPGNHLTPVVVTLSPPEELSQLTGSLPQSVGDEKAARELGVDIAQWLTRAAM